MLTKVTAYSQWSTVDPIVWNILERPEADLFEVRNIEGLGAVKANINTVPLGSADGEDFTGTNVGKRNLVFTIGLNPDWATWDFSKLRRLLELTFSPKLWVRLVLETTEFLPVEISGYVESNDPNMFSKDPEQQISIICPKPNFKAVTPTVISGQTTDAPIEINYEGNVETGIHVQVSKSSGADPGYAGVRIDDTYIFAELTGIGSPVDDTRNFEMNSVPGSKYIRSILLPDNTVINLLNYAQIGIKWPVLIPKVDTFSVETTTGIQDWILTYTALFGSL